MKTKSKKKKREYFGKRAEERGKRNIYKQKDVRRKERKAVMKESAE